MNRRNFFRDSLFSAAGIMLASETTGKSTRITSSAHHPVSTSTDHVTSSFDIIKELMKYRKISAHEHVKFGGKFEEQLAVADKLWIQKMEISRPISTAGSKATPDEFRKCNDLVLKAMKQHPDRFLGSCYVNPVYGKESLEEIKRCIDQGMTGLKVYNQVKINDPLFYPIIEKFIELKMIILMHASDGIGVGGKRTKYGNAQPNLSLPEDFVEAAKRYPEAMFQYAHTGGGGDWQSACKTIQDYSNIYVDTSGSNNQGSMIDYVLKYLGENRIFFGTDGSYFQGVGVVLASKLNDAQKKKVFFENYNDILRKSGNNVD